MKPRGTGGTGLARCAAGVRRTRVSRTSGFRQWKWYLDEAHVKISCRQLPSDGPSPVLPSCSTDARDGCRETELELEPLAIGNAATGGAAVT